MTIHIESDQEYINRKHKINFILSKHPDLKNTTEDNYFLFKHFLIGEYSKMTKEEINIEYEFYMDDVTKEHIRDKRFSDLDTYYQDW